MSSLEAACSSVGDEDRPAIQDPWNLLSPPASSCPICMEYSFGIIVKTICGHVFRGQCLLNWFRSLGSTADYASYKCTCPMCREVVAIVFRPHKEAKQNSEESSGGVENEEESTNVVETLGYYNDHEETDYLAQT